MGKVTDSFTEECRKLLGKRVRLTFCYDPHRTVTGILHGITTFGEATIKDDDTGEIAYIWPALNIRELKE